ncbi:disease resistance protein [Fagus crenata]
MNSKVLEDSLLMALYDFDSSELPERLECPQVKLIILERQKDALQIPNTFFEGVKNLKVLVLSDICLTKLPSSLLFLDNLQALHLIDCELEDIAMIGELKNLKECGNKGIGGVETREVKSGRSGRRSLVCHLPSCSANE